jgi:hypothetical protein
MDLTLFIYQKNFGDPGNKQGFPPNTGSIIFLLQLHPQTLNPCEPSGIELIRNCHMKPKHHSYFCVNALDLDNIILFILNQDQADLLEDTSCLNLALVGHACWEMLLLCKQIS